MRRNLALLVVLASVLGGCLSAAPRSPSAAPSAAPSTAPDATVGATLGTLVPGGELVRSDVPRAEGSAEAARTAASAINAFGIDLLRAIGGRANAVISPTSIALALGMARVGARGGTGTEIDAAFHLSNPDEFTAGLNALDQALATYNGTVPDGSGASQEVSLQIASQLFVQRGLALEQPFVDRLASDFGAGLRLADFRADPEAARLAVNRWADEQTGGRIPTLLGPGAVDTATRLVAANAIYLKAPWANVRFDPAQTTRSTFTTADGTAVSVPMMTSHLPGGTEPSLPYAAGDGWRAVQLAYLGPDSSRSRLALALIAPDDLAAFEAALTSERLAGILADLADRKVELALPRFGIDTQTELSVPLQALGIHLAFDRSEADFSGITTSERLHVAAVIHQANIDVDEKGTEAAAATAIMMMTGGPGDTSEPIVLRLDRPFLFALRDTETGAILFLGRVADPSTR